MMKVVKVTAILGTLFFSTSLYATETKIILQLGIEAGGEELVETTATDLTAGGGVNIGGGVSIEPENSTLAYVATIGYTFDEVDFDLPPGSTSFNVIPLEFTVRKKLGANQAHHVGGGLTYHLNPEWELCFSGAGCNTAEFDSALGFNILYSYNFQSMFLTGKYTFMEYDIAGVSVDADGFGLLIGFRF